MPKYKIVLFLVAASVLAIEQIVYSGIYYALQRKEVGEKHNERCESAFCDTNLLLNQTADTDPQLDYSQNATQLRNLRV